MDKIHQKYEYTNEAEDHFKKMFHPCYIKKTIMEYEPSNEKVVRKSALVKLLISACGRHGPYTYPDVFNNRDLFSNGGLGQKNAGV